MNVKDFNIFRLENSESGTLPNNAGIDLELKL